MITEKKLVQELIISLKVFYYLYHYLYTDVFGIWCLVFGLHRLQKILISCSYNYLFVWLRLLAFGLKVWDAGDLDRLAEKWKTIIMNVIIIIKIVLFSRQLFFRSAHLLRNSLFIQVNNDNAVTQPIVIKQIVKIIMDRTENIIYFLFYP